MRKLRTLCGYIEQEADVLRHEADFMQMGPRTTIDAITSSVEKLIGSAKSVLSDIRHVSSYGAKN